MFDDGVRVSNSNVVGHIAGGDINDLSTKMIFSGSKGVYMKSLLDRYKKDCEGSQVKRDFIDDLDYYNNKRDGDVIGLEEKLTMASREDLFWYANDAKDRFQRFLFKNQFSEAAQQIFVHLLTEIQSRFLNEIYQALCNGESQEKVNLLITERLINPVKEELGENYLGITAMHINGMLYFLTGNCHLKWTK
ncbi:ABC-three component system protein [Pedobacter gandavensis]|uniref:ABC-three component system protein n=1 Tax=Pedobacter gandavensis TaxID=2679963 RepID=UPI00292FA6B8|nr:ABC-three component system protein [Pedobacter gandavensis]